MTGDLVLGIVLGALIACGLSVPLLVARRRRPTPVVAAAEPPHVPTAPVAALPPQVLSETVTAAVVAADWSRAVWVADTFQAVTGLDTETFRADPTTLCDLVAVMDRRRLDLLAGDQPGRAIMRVRDLGTGDYRSLLCVVEPIEADAEGAFALTIVDLAIVDRRAAELEVRIGDLEHAMAQQRWLSTELSHDLRSPLNALLGSSQLLEGSRLEPRERRAAERMASAGAQLRTLIDDALDIERLVSGAVAFDREPVNAERQVIEVVNTLMPLAAKRGVSLVSAATGHRDSTVWGDAKSMSRILTNLIANAIKFTPPGGEVRVSAGSTEAGVRLLVADTGPGISEADRLRVFEPFERLGADTEGVPGTGIGLVLCRRLVEAMGGTIGVESPPAGGSVFWFELPGAPAGAAASGSRHLTPTVLCIEDDPDNQELLSDALEAVDITTFVASSATRGLEMIESLRPAVVVVDAHLPDMSTSAFFDALAAVVRSGGPSLVVVSGSIDRSELLPFQGVIKAQHAKPVDLDALVGDIIDLLGRRTRTEPIRHAVNP